MCGINEHELVFPLTFFKSSMFWLTLLQLLVAIIVAISTSQLWVNAVGISGKGSPANIFVKQVFAQNM